MKSARINALNMCTAVDHTDKCVSDYLVALETSRFSDVTIRIGENELKAHRLVLCLRSPVLSSMLSDTEKFKEGQESVIEVPDSDHETFKIFLQYLYSGTVELQPENVLHLHHLAEKYMVGSLTESCISYVLANIAEENVLWFLDTALLFSIRNLQESCLEFIQTNPGALTSKNLQHLREETMKEILSIECTSNKEGDFLDFLLEWKACNQIDSIGHLLGYIKFPIISPVDLAKYYHNPDIPPELLLEAFAFQANPILFEGKGDKFRARELRNEIPELLTLEDLKEIERVTKKRLGEKLYSLTCDGDSITTFHRLCDPHSDTLTVIKTSEAIFGGYSDVSWGENKGYVNSHNAVLFYKKTGERAKVFDTKEFELESGVYCHRSWGPNFGGCTPFGLKKMSELSLNTWPKWRLILIERQVQSLDVFLMRP